MNNLNLLKEKVNKSNQITNGMVNILSSFEHRLARLEETILPVYNETGNLQRRQESKLQISIYSNHFQNNKMVNTLLIHKISVFVLH